MSKDKFPKEAQEVIDKLELQIEGMYESHSNKCSQYEDRIYALYQRIEQKDREIAKLTKSQ